MSIFNFSENPTDFCQRLVVGSKSRQSCQLFEKKFGRNSITIHNGIIFWRHIPSMEYVQQLIHNRGSQGIFRSIPITVARMGLIDKLPIAVTVVDVVAGQPVAGGFTNQPGSDTPDKTSAPSRSYAGSAVAGHRTKPDENAIYSSSNSD
jgi:hypothetical protein